MKRVYNDVEGFKLTSSSKTELIQPLIVAVEQRPVTWPQEGESLAREMKRYEYAIFASGGITYNAPGGYHDDCVMVLALAKHRRWETEHVGRMMPVGTGIMDDWGMRLRRRGRRMLG